MFARATRQRLRRSPSLVVSEQTATLSCNNKNIHDVITHMIPGYDSTKRYKVSGYLDAESRVLYFDMTEAEVSVFRASDKVE